MYCNRCRIEFEPWTDKWGGTEKRYCPTCHQKTWTAKPGEFTGIDHYCVICGDTLPKAEKKSKNGKLFLSSAHLRYCANHKPLPQGKAIRTCIVCGVEIGRSIKYCADHKPLPKKVNPVINRRTSIAWQKENPEKVKAAQKARYNPYAVSILYECQCQHPKKHNHHFDYEFPTLVIRLCPACHAAEHKRLRSLAAPAQAVNQ